MAVVLNLGALAMAWAFARVLWGPLAAIVALLTIVGSPVVIAEIALFHTDLPAAGLLLALMLLVWYEFERRPEPSRLLIAAAPLAALAFYVRYGSILPIGGIGIAAVVLWHRSMLRNKGLVGLTVALAALLFAPHILEAISRTGSPLGIITSAGEQVDTSEPIATAARYLGWLPSQLAHRLGFVVMLAGVVHAAIVAIDAIRRRELGPVARRYLLAVRPGRGHDASVSSCNRTRSSGTSCSRSCSRSSPGPGPSPPRLPGSGRDRARGPATGVDGAIVVGILLVAVIAGSVGARRLVVLEREGDESRWQPAVGRAIEADADGPMCRGHLGPADHRVVLAMRGRARSRPAARRFWRASGSIEPTYIVFSNIDQRRASPATIQRYRALLEVLKANGIPIYGVEPGVEVDRLTR